jgi:peptidoglycan LD-endopeptidase LytH
MVRVAVLATLLLMAAWLARDAEWLSWPPAWLPPGLTGSATARERYLQSLDRAGLLDTLAAQTWEWSAEQALGTPTRLSVPIDRRVTFTDAALAAAFRVRVLHGQRLEVTASAETPLPGHSFIDIYEVEADQPRLRAGTFRAGAYEPTADRELIVRVQPELQRRGPVRLQVRAVPALAFPVAASGAPVLQSVFGDPRDGGRRRHEGVDIFAKRGTPVVAAAGGVVTRVGEGGLGGRVVWVWDPSRSLLLYYAHLQEQLVAVGRQVRAGEPIGTVGNTGNARTTPPHLHFGIYRRGAGAIDPQAFIAPVTPAD